MKTFKMNKIQLCLVTFGIIIGIVGILHGCGELLKGSALVESNSTEALPVNWPNSEFYSTMKGSPVFSVLTGLPHYALSLLAISVSITMISFSVTLFKHETFGLILFSVLSVGVFLFGAGRGTPFAISLPMIIFGVLSNRMTSKKNRNDSSKRVILSSFYVFSGFTFLAGSYFSPAYLPSASTEKFRKHFLCLISR